MRLALITVSAIALSGCTWFGGGAQTGSHGFNGQAAAQCGPQGGYANGYNLQGGGCGPAGGYGVAGGQAGGQYGQQAGFGQQAAFSQQAGFGQQAGFAQAGYGQQQAGYGQQQGGGYGYGYTAGYAQGYGSQTNGLATQGLRGSYGGAAGYGQQATTLGASAPYGAAVGGQFGGANVQTVQGAPIYVQQPYAAYGNQGCAGGGNSFNGGCGVVGVSLPFGFEAGVGTEFGLSGNVFPGEPSKESTPGIRVSDLASISYSDAFDPSFGVDLATTYDVGPNTTLLTRVGYQQADGQAVTVGTVSDGIVTEDLVAEFTDLNQYTIEGGVRQYLGNVSPRGTGIRPYVGATAGASYNDDVELTQSSATLVDPALFTQTFIDSGWNATASGLVGAEWQVGARSAIGVETGIRWTEDLDTNFPSEDRWSVPVRLRGRVSF